MKAKTLLILTSGLLGMALIIGGAYITITELIQPSGLLFEGIVLTSLGFTLNMIILIASTIGKTINIFGEILAKQTSIHNELNKVQASKNNGLGSLLSGMLPGNVTIRDLNNPDSPGTSIPLGEIDSIDKLGKLFSSGIPGGKKTLKDMNNEELETALSKALKEDNFERAEEINQEVLSRKSPDTQEDTPDDKK